MASGLIDLYGDLLGMLEADRQAHSVAVGRKAALRRGLFALHSELI